MNPSYLTPKFEEYLGVRNTRMVSEKGSNHSRKIPRRGIKFQPTERTFGEKLGKDAKKQTLGTLSAQQNLTTKFKPGNRVKKLDFNDFSTLGDQVLNDDFNRLNFVQEFNSNTMEESHRNESKIKSINSRKKTSHESQTFLGDNPDNLRHELLKVSQQIKEDLGFGFESKEAKKLNKVEFNDGMHSALLPTDFSKSKLVGKSISSIQGRILEQRRKYQQSQQGFTPSLFEQKEKSPSAKSKSNAGIRKKISDSAKLNQIAKIFRHALEADKSDPTDIIKLPQSNKKSPNKGAPKISKPFLGKPKILPRELGDELDASQITYRGNRNRSAGVMELRQLLEINPPPQSPLILSARKWSGPTELARQKIQTIEEGLFQGEIQGVFGSNSPPSAQFADYLKAINTTTADNEKFYDGHTSSAKTYKSGEQSRSKTQTLMPQYPIMSTAALQNQLEMSSSRIEEVQCKFQSANKLMARVNGKRSTPISKFNLVNSNSHRPYVNNVAPSDKSARINFEVNGILERNSAEEQRNHLGKLVEEMDKVLGNKGKVAITTGRAVTSAQGCKESKPLSNPSVLSCRVSQNTTIKNDENKSYKNGIQIQTEPTDTSKLLSTIKFIKDMSQEDQFQLEKLRALKPGWDTFEKYYGKTMVFD